MLEVTKVIKDPRGFFTKIQAVASVVFVFFHFLIIALGKWTPPEGLLARAILYFGVPLILLSLYLTVGKKIFSQRTGDIIHTCVLVLVISAFSIAYSGKVGGDFVFLFFLLIAVSIFFLDDFLPLFTSILTSLIIIAEFFITTNLSGISYLSVFRPILQIMSFLIVGWACSNLVKRTISETKKTEALQKTTEELEKAYRKIKSLSEMKTEFLKVVNHQLRTPVSIVKGMLSMLEEGSLSGEQKQDFIEKAYLASERLTTILDDILTAQRLTGGPPGISLSPCKIEDLIRDIIKHFQPFTKRKNLELKFKEPKEPLPLVFLDKEIVKRTISRLVDNAILYTKEGEVIVSLSTVNKEDKKFIVIKVRDSGIGLTEEEKKSLFRLFYRGDKATSTHPNGSGLGLFIVKNMIEAHHGEVEVESEGRGKGTTFSVKLPLRTEV